MLDIEVSSCRLDRLEDDGVVFECNALLGSRPGVLKGVNVVTSGQNLSFGLRRVLK